MKAGMQKYIEIGMIKNGKISSVYEDKKGHNASTKKKTEGDLETKLEKMRNYIKEIKKVIVNKNKDWLETTENKRKSQRDKIEKEKKEKSLNKNRKRVELKKKT